MPHVKNVFAHVGTPSFAIGQGLGIKITKSGKSFHARRKQPAEAMVKRGSLLQPQMFPQCRWVEAEVDVKWAEISIAGGDFIFTHFVDNVFH